MPRGGARRRDDERTIPPRLLVVDDDADLRELIAGFLRDHHLEVETAADAEAMDAALAAAEIRLRDPRSDDAGRGRPVGAAPACAGAIARR